MNHRHFYMTDKYTEIYYKCTGEAFTSEGRGDYFISFKRHLLPMFMKKGVYFPRNGQRSSVFPMVKGGLL